VVRWRIYRFGHSKGISLPTHHSTQQDTILELACLVTDQDLNIVAEGPDLIIHHPDEVLDNMNDWCIKHHGESGLTKSVKESKLTMKGAEDALLAFVQKHTLPKKSP